VVHVALDEGGLSPGGDPGSSGSGQAIPSVVFRVTGNYGSQAITGTADFGVGDITENSETVAFSGRMGSRILDGHATARTGSGRTLEITAHLTVAPAS